MSNYEEGNVRVRLMIEGRVQGVGFRPFVYRLAIDAGLAGFVRNDTRGVEIEVEGAHAAIEEFTRRLESELPPAARIKSLDTTGIGSSGETGFRILPSAATGERRAEISADIATCEDCLRELADPEDRRYRYPFINCTNCGPRYTIIKGVPYDRPLTTMAAFEMCPDCRAEYDDPADRRFHAQPNACPVCGPQVRLLGRDGTEVEGDPFKEAGRMLREGAILAVKGLGGFHLACRADDDEVVEKLRMLKGREAKPFAVMVGSVDIARRIAEVDDAAADALLDPARPILLIKKREGALVSDAVAPGTDSFGIMLPYAPIHYLLFEECPEVLVMTSGNPTAEPLSVGNDEAFERLSDIADAFLVHDRDIERRVDDSVARAVAGESGRTQLVPIRRARGFAPEPIRITRAATKPVLALGAELKSTICLLEGNEAILSEHLGELENPHSYRNFTATVDRFIDLYGFEPEAVACDMHPDYAATQFARTLGLRVVEVQHHHAHVVSCMAEHGLTGSVVGVSCDGTGYGTDGNVWGGEILVADEGDFDRYAHLAEFKLAGGDSAARECWRPALGAAYEAYGDDWRGYCDFAFDGIGGKRLEITTRRIASSASVPATTSLGRLFDAVAFILGIRTENRFEAEAAIALETAARECDNAAPLAFEIREAKEGARELDWRPMFRELTEGTSAELPVPALARAFHETVAAMLAEGAREAAYAAGLDRIVLSGGCFANRLLLERVVELIRDAGLGAYVHEKVPTGDGGIALGQAVAASAWIEGD